MKKALIFSSLAILAAVAAPEKAMALDTCKFANVALVNGPAQVIDLGTWHFELNQLVYTDGYEACAYFVKWINNCILPSSTNLYIEELTTPGLEDCEVNSLMPVHSVVFASPAYISRGFDKFQNKRIIQSLVLGETLDGCMNGVI